MRSSIAAGIVVLALACTTHAVVYEVGDGRLYTSIGAVPWESLAAGDTVLIYWRAAPYKEKWVISRQGTLAAPITVRGVAHANGALPIIDGSGATTRLQLDYWSETRGVIKVGGSSIPADVMPRHIVIENLDIRSARSPNTFTDDGGASATYSGNASSIFVEKGENITIRNCIIHDSGNGLFVASSDDDVSRNILIEGNYIYDNGNSGSIYEHNTYTAAIGITYQFNRFGPLKSGAGGNNLKDRSAGLVVRYNWIESGNRQLDLVDAEDSVVIQNDATYRRTFVYGNVLIEPDGAGNKQILHYGGDSGNEPTYRKGKLHFYHNTVVSTRATGTTLMRLSTNEETCDARNNIIWVTAAGSTLSWLDSTGILDISHNLLKSGWIAASSGLSGVLNNDGTSVQPASAGFIDLAAQDFHLRADSAARDAATGLHAEALPLHDITQQYVLHRAAGVRTAAGAARDIGAFEFTPGDTDGDGEVSLVDFDDWPTCVTGPVPATLPAACHPLDFNGDQRIDLADFAAFQIAAD
jgi:hypothetical protein